MSHTEKMQQAVEQIDRLLTKRLTENLGPGLALALTTKDGLIASRAYGEANTYSGEPVTERTLFQIGSITKHFTAVACLKLHERGRLDVQAPVTDVLDWFEVQSEFDTPVTFHHLLTHTSGLIMMIDTVPSSWAQTWMLRDTVLGFEPGSKFSYSNVGYNVLQCAIQSITGMSLDASLRELIFEPLGMEETYGEIRNGHYDRMARGHKLSAHDDRPVSRPERQTVVNWYELSEGCGSVVTTATDLARFLRMELNGGRADDGSVFLKPESFEMLTHPYIEMPHFFPNSMQGYGVLIEQSEETNEHRRIIGGGENLGYEAAMYGDLDAGLGVVLFCNSYDIPWRETRWILSVLLSAAEGRELPEWPHGTPQEPTLLGETAAEYVGHYESGDRSFDIADADGRLRLSADGETTILERIWGDAFIASLPGFDHAMLSFGRNDEGTVVEAFQLGDWYRNDAYDGPETYDRSPDWGAYAGQYRAFGLFVNSLRFFVRKGMLMCQSYGGYSEEPMTDLGDGVFRFGDETSPHRATFDWPAGGKTLRCRVSDGDFYRVE